MSFPGVIFVVSFFPLLMGIAVYRLLWHPLASFKGPKLAAVTDWWFCKKWLNGRYHQTLEKLQLQYGDVIRIAPNELVFATPEAARDIYTRCNPDQDLQFIKQPPFYKQSEGFPTLVTETDPAAHRTLRKPLERGFSPSSLKDYGRVIERVADDLTAQLEKASEHSNAVDVKAWAARFTFDVITEVTFGKSSGTVAQGKNTVWLDLLTGNIAAAAVGVAIRRQPHAVKTLLRSIFAKLSKTAKLRAQYLSVCRKMCEERLRDPPKAANLFDHVLATCPPVEKDADNHGYLVFLQGQAAALVSGGTETSSTLLSSLIYNLLAHPAHLARLQYEVRNAFSQSGEIDIESTKQLKYLQAVIDESLRIFPPVGFGLPRVCPGAMIGGVYVPKGTVVQAPDILMVRNSRYFVRPYEFLPERWLPKDHEFYDEQFSGDRKEASKPFSLGPRQCIGMSLAYAEWRIVLAKLVLKFDWEIIGETQDLMDVARLKLLWEMPPILVSFKPVGGLAAASPGA
uniref:Cytochrome P450 monooxygenase btcC n=1 Tax=Neocamarosporium betae TaxID=1979465 RepID=BTCC_NEOBT|nr:RecName: Full=Cytochrome P450 monooxygenase btcC; AltName: Full=Betaestacins biosynthesis cluster protein C [Neocamarosporium betae]BBE36500.1 putative cytochrome P450 [Neocamarosporium betae]